MAQRPTEALPEPARAAVQADEAERDRIAWNLPRSTADKAARRADDGELDLPAAARKPEEDQ